MSRIPEIKVERGIPTLYVRGEPFFAYGGEVHNSSGESLDYMEEKVWKKLKGMNLNALTVPLYWDRIEPVEGVFDFSLLDGLVAQARAYDMHLIFLWFGLWKNAESMYVPGWMKQDTRTYFRAEKVNGDKMNTISPLCETAILKDANAFSLIMDHIRQIDQEISTVVMMQVENEVGLLGMPCDYCPQAREAFRQQIPLALRESGKEGTWREAFGEDGEEAFMAWNFASAIERITKAGQEKYPLPCYANAWLRQYPWYAGSYPSGGPVRRMHQIWKKAAPSLFTLAPDIYVPYVPDILEEYSYPGNPLVVPEVRKDAVTASYALYAYMHHHALCYSPFGIEDLGEEPEKAAAPTDEMIKALKMDPLSFDLTGSKDALAGVYRFVEEMKPLSLKYRGTPYMKSYLQRQETDQGTYLRFEKYDIQVDYYPKAPGCPAAAGVICQLGEDEFLLSGMMSRFLFFPKAGENVRIDFLRIEKGSVQHGSFLPYQEMNGDERMMVFMLNKLASYRVKLYKY